ncbi:S-methyl-5'-thioadenosine phosphorylase-like [Oscarella lobularis]|uniref:S-methyl-5'-thioadenosine phosphorylase-like n=1 Tax=Oscarella lobularis TaxID=121494 RepID=UPI003314160E
MATSVKIGIIGGSGVEDASVFEIEDRKEMIVETPFGPPSDKLITGKVSGIDCVFLSRHAKGHKIMPSRINYRANIHALKSLGCTHILATNAHGSLRENVHPGTLVFPTQFIDRTTSRRQTFFDNSTEAYPGVCHVPMAEPFCLETRQILVDVCQKENIDHYKIEATTVTIEGPRFSTRAESKLFRSWGADIIGMTTVPEVVLAKEASMCYCCIALPTDYDSWKEEEEGVTVQHVVDMFKSNVTKAAKLIHAAIPVIAARDWTQKLKHLKDVVDQAVMG